MPLIICLRFQSRTEFYWFFGKAIRFPRESRVQVSKAAIQNSPLSLYLLPKWLQHFRFGQGQVKWLDYTDKHQDKQLTNQPANLQTNMENT